MKLHLPKKLFQAVLLAVSSIAAYTSNAADSISINFTHEGVGITSSTTGELGGVAASGWNNVAAADTTGTTVNNQNGEAAGIITISNVANSWESEIAAGESLTSVVQQGYIDVPNHTNRIYTITVDHNYWLTDVTFYMSGDTANAQFAPLKVNGTNYIGGTNQTGDGGWGNGGDPAGVTEYSDTNSIHVTGVTGDLTIQNVYPSGQIRATLAGMQVFDASTTSGYMTTLGSGETAATDATWTNQGNTVSYADITEKNLGITGATEGSTLKLSGGETINSLAALGNSVTITADDAITATDLYANQDATLVVNATLNSSNMSIRGSGSVSINGDLSVNGNTLSVSAAQASISGKLYSKNGTINLGDGKNAGIITVGRVEVGDLGSGTSTLNIESGYTLKVTGNANTIQDDPNLYKTNSFVVSEWNNTTTMNVKGTILAENAAVLTGDSGVVINIEKGGTLATKGLGRSHPGKTAVSTINLKEGGKLILGDMGLDYAGYVNTNISGGTIGLAAESVTIAESLNITGNLTIDTNRYSYGDSGLTQGETGGTLILNGNLTGSGSLESTGKGTLQFGSIDSSVSISTGDTNISFGGTLSLSDEATFTVGTGTFVVDTSSAGNFVVLDHSNITDKDGMAAVNGFASGQRTLINGGTITGTISLMYDGQNYEITDTSRTFGPSDSVDLSTWYITSDSSTLSEIYTQSATAGVSAAAGTTLNVDTALASGTGIELTGGATMNISEGQSLSAGSLTTNGHTVTLDGKGTYTINSGNATDVTTAESWSGTVELFGQSNAGLDLADYGRSGSTISIKSYVGSFANAEGSAKAIDANLILTNTNLAAVELTHGYSGCTYNFNGSVSGNGNFIVNKDLSGGKMTFNFNGDTSGWTGRLEVVNGTHNVKFSGTSTVANNEIRSRGSNTTTMGLTIDNANNAVGVSSHIYQNDGSQINLTVTKGTTATFTNTVDVTTLEALGNLSFTAQDALNVTNLTGGNVGTLTIKDGAGSVSASGSATLTGGATINASLTLGNGATLEMDGLVTDAVTVNGVLTFGGQLTMGDKLQEIVLEMAAWPTPELVLFDGLDSFTFGETLVTAGAEVQASEYFSNISDETLYVTYRQVDNVGSLVMFSIVPEPATTTLSLLALAGLAARRRRR